MATYALIGAAMRRHLDRRPPVGIKPKPGPSELIAGSMQAGFFGEVDPFDFVDGVDLAAAVGLTAGSEINTYTKWLKFVYQDRTFYIPMKPIRNNLTWADLYAKNIVYGEDGIGKYPPSGQSVDQKKIVVIDDNAYIVRLMRGSDVDPTNQAGGEWDALMRKVSANDPTQSFWARYTDTDLGLSSATLCMESALTTNLSITRGINGISTFSWGSKTTVNVGTWRPVLELIPDSDYLFEPTKVDADSQPFMLPAGGLDVTVTDSVNHASAIDAFDQNLMFTLGDLSDGYTQYVSHASAIDAIDENLMFVLSGLSDSVDSYISGASHAVSVSDDGLVPVGEIEFTFTE